MDSIPYRILANGVRIPAIGMGTYPLCGKKLTKAMLAAVNNGYRLFDTAHSYPNEKDMGNALKEIYKQTSLKRRDLFITSKIGDKLDKGFPIGYYFYKSSSCPNHDVEQVVNKQLQESLNKLQVDYLDLLLIHWPYYDTLNEIWNAFEKIYNKGLVRAIGVSNCKPRHIERILKTAEVAPMLNQLYFSPLNTQKETVDYCQNKGVLLESYSPLMALRMNNQLNDNSLFSKMCAKYQKGKAQIILRWNYQKGVIPIPKSGNTDRIASNIAIFDFELSPEEVKFIDEMNENYQYLPESRYCPGY